jgi:hypothetical protein
MASRQGNQANRSNAKACRRRRTPSKNRERKTMHAGTKRIVIGAAVLTAAGLFGSLPFDGTHVAQQGVPTVHRDVALVDIILTDEGTLDTTLFNDVLGPTGAEEQLFNTLATALSGGTLDNAGITAATTLLDATGASPIFSGDFDGAESRLFEGLFLNTLVGEDELNQALGESATASQTELLSVFNADFVPLPSGTTDPVLGAGFDTDLTSIANADYTLAGGDFEGFLANLATDTSGLTDVSTLLTDLSSSFSDLTNLTPELSTIFTDLGGLL